MGRLILFFGGNFIETTNLYIPLNIKTRFEFFDGYGIAELIPTIIAAVVSGFIAFTLA